MIIPHNKTIRVHDLTVFCQNVIDSEITTEKRNRISIRFLFVPIPLNGCLRACKKSDALRYQIMINLFPFLVQHFSSNHMRFFYLYATIIHELHHIELLENEKASNYAELLAFWEEFQQLSHFRWVDSINTWLIQKNAMPVKRKKYSVSMAEILCNLISFQKSYKFFSQYLSASERQTIKEIIESLEFLKGHINIGYRSSKQPLNLFTKTIQEVQFTIKKQPQVFTKPSPLDHLFTCNGQVKSFDQIYSERNHADAQVIDSILLNWFICADIEFSSYFKTNPNFKLHIESLANQYCDNLIQYLKNEKKGLVFLREDVLQDNTAMMLKNANRLNKLMTQYDMVHTGGSVIPLYHT